jgi:PadR family transcriptional regulator PadR
MVKGHLDGLLLAVLADGPAHGYAVIEELRQRSSGVFDLPEGTVYPALHRLEQGGYLKSAWSEGSPRRRRVYQLTARGRRELTAERTRWENFTDAVDTVWKGTAWQSPA